jgi:hypothetical protein
MLRKRPDDCGCARLHTPLYACAEEGWLPGAARQMTAQKLRARAKRRWMGFNGRRAPIAPTKRVRT